MRDLEMDNAIIAKLLENMHDTQVRGFYPVSFNDYTTNLFTID